MPADLDLDVHMRLDKDVEPREPVALDGHSFWLQKCAFDLRSPIEASLVGRDIVGGCIFILATNGGIQNSQIFDTTALWCSWKSKIGLVGNLPDSVFYAMK